MGDKSKFLVISPASCYVDHANPGSHRGADGRRLFLDNENHNLMRVNVPFIKRGKCVVQEIAAEKYFHHPKIIII